MDRIIELDPGKTARGIVAVSAGTCRFPDLLMVEAMAQLGGIAAGHGPGEGGFLAAINQAEFTGSAAGGDTLEVSVQVVKSFGNLHMLEGTVTRGGSPLARAGLTLAVGNL